MSDFQLTSEQQYIFDLCENTNDNILIHGKPGVGKSVLINALRTTGQKHYTLAAPTGLAALNINGKTLHSTFGITPSEGIYEPDFNIFTKNDFVLNHVYHRVKHLIIDEVSMVRADMLDYIDRVLKSIKMNDQPFGGIQVILVGDFFQLPPVAQAKDIQALERVGYKSQFAFSAHCFKDFKLTALTQVLRQNEKEFIDILHASRSGKITTAQLKRLNNNIGKCDDFRIQLTAVNKQADLINMKQLSLIKEKATIFEANKYGWWPANPVEQTIELKTGAQVMIKKNNADRAPGIKSQPASGKLVNGTICKIKSIPEQKGPESALLPVIVELEDGTELPVYKQRWERKEKKRNADDRWEEVVVSWYEQYPFQLAWAISMHKSQGQSFDKVHIDASRVFEAGQLYVAISRCRSIDGLSFQSPLTIAMFKINEHVLKFNTWLERTSTAPALEGSALKKAKKKS